MNGDRWPINAGYAIPNGRTETYSTAGVSLINGELIAVDAYGEPVEQVEPRPLVTSSTPAAGRWPDAVYDAAMGYMAD